MGGKLGIFSDFSQREWFDYGSYIDIRRRILYVETPKAACSSIKQFLRSIATARPLELSPISPETRLSMLIHDRPQMPFPSLNEFPQEDVNDVLSSPEWFRFCIVRHPFERFFSAWRDKIFLCEPRCEKYISDRDKKFIEFTQFADSVFRNESPNSCNPHWRSQNALLLPERINYSKIYHMADLGMLHSDLQNHIRSCGIDENLGPIHRYNEGFSISSEGFLSEDIVDKLRKFYEDDFNVFGFDERQGVKGSARSASQLTNQFTDAVFDRNRVISEHARLGWLAEEARRRRERLLHRRIIRRLTRYSKSLVQVFLRKHAPERA